MGMVFTGRDDNGEEFVGYNQICNQRNFRRKMEPEG